MPTTGTGRGTIWAGRRLALSRSMSCSCCSVTQHRPCSGVSHMSPQNYFSSLAGLTNLSRSKGDVEDLHNTLKYLLSRSQCFLCVTRRSRPVARTVSHHCNSVEWHEERPTSRESSKHCSSSAPLSGAVSSLDQNAGMCFSSMAFCMGAEHIQSDFAALLPKHHSCRSSLLWQYRESRAISLLYVWLWGPSCTSA